MAGDDTLDGGAGVDIAAYRSARGDHTIISTASGFTVSETEGTDTLVSVERFRFTDVNLAFDIGLGQAAGNTVRVIGAAFDGPAIQAHPDWVGIGLSFFDGGMDMLQVCDLLAAILGLTNTAFVSTVFTNVVGFPPDTATLNGFVGLLQGSGGPLTQGQLLEIAAINDLNAININLVGLQVSGVEFI